MTRHSRFERAQRERENARIAEIETAWRASVPAAEARAFEDAVKAARTREPEGKRPDMAPGTAPRPPRPGHEPRPPKETNRPRRRR